MKSVPPDVLHHLKHHRQEHVLFGWDALSECERGQLIGDIAGIDLGELDTLYRRRNEPHAVLPPRDRIAPLAVEPWSEISSATIAIGDAAIRAGEVAVLLVAGGQGSRLGSDKPKGIFAVGPVSGASLFQIHAEKVLALRRNYAARVPFLVMTSHATHADTEAYFEANDYFGLPSDDVYFFQQGTMPALDLQTGKLLLEKPGQLFLSPNGHGGSLTALADSGILAKLKATGVRHVFYFQVDNPLTRIADPAFVGRHIEVESEASSKVVFKEQPEEKVGMLSQIDGRCGIIEYSDLPAEMANERTPTGELTFRAGSPAIHLFSVPFLEKVTSGSTRLAYHLAQKKVPCLNERAEPFVPTTENALKFEMFVFDALPLADRWLAVSVERTDEFAPLKNATGADSAQTVRQLLIARASKWLEIAGVSVPRTAQGEPIYPVEIRPTFALDEVECKRKITRGTTITAPTLFD